MQITMFNPQPFHFIPGIFHISLTRTANTYATINSDFRNYNAVIPPQLHDPKRDSVVLHAD